MKYQQVCNLDRSASTTHRYTQTATRVQSISDISARNSCIPDESGKLCHLTMRSHGMDCCRASWTCRYVSFAGLQGLLKALQHTKLHDNAAGPELEVPAYGCEDHFQELDTAEHSWECIAELLRGKHTHDILCDVGMPIIHRG